MHFFVSHLFLDCRPLSLQKPPPGWRDWKSAAVKIGGIYMGIQTELLT